MADGGLKVAAVDVRAESRHDGSILLTNGVPLPPVMGTIPQRLAHWASERPGTLFLTEGDRELRYGAAEATRRRLAQRLLGLPASAHRPLMIVARNGIDHALVMLAATSVGIPVAVISPAYIVAAAAPFEKFRRILDRLSPAAIFADDVEALQAAMGGAFGDVGLFALRDPAALDKVEPVDSAELDAAEAAVGLDSVAKLLLTSGSTGLPKAVPNTQRMMVSNMLGLAEVWPFLHERPPVSVDWLPWNHTFGGNCCFNITLWFGGHSHIDDGRPAPGLINRTVEALRRFRPTLFYNVPVGVEALLPFFEADADLARDVFSRLDFVFNGGAPLPSALRARIETVARSAAGRVPMIVAGWGSTETAPFSTILYFEQPHANNLGAPMPGTIVKMVPADGRFELRVKGPNVMQGYWGDADATVAAFDEEGFYKIGDAGKFADPRDPKRGVLFDGRVAENFKLTSGTWVNVGALRLAVISAGENLISDAVVAGEGRSDIGLLLFPNEAACRELAGSAACGALPDGISAATLPEVRASIEKRMAVYNASQFGSSTRIARYVVLDEPPNAARDEITEKGYINQRRVLENRQQIVEALYSDDARQHS